MLNIRIAKYLFFLVSALDLLGIILHKPLLIYISKPLIIPMLWLLYKLQVSKQSYFYGIALFCSFVGDTVLMFDGLNSFMLGLVSFLVAHVFYIVILRKRIQKFKFSKLIKVGIPFLILVVCLVVLLETKGLNEMLYPVILYALTIGLFGSFALYSYIEQKTEGTKLMLIGAVLFIVSDSVLAINAFYEPFYWLNLVVMITYIGAQYYIYKSMLSVSKEPISDQ